jgi:predicted RNase H-like nuclease (RuvC/YqgF family)
MGIFKKGKNEPEFELETNPVSKQNNFEPDASREHSTPSSAGSPKASIKQSYGIEDAIALMRKLPNVNSEITITVVKKTLESANIQVEEIISDAARKESQIETRTEQLSKEISELQDRISHLNDEINELTSDLKETTKVKILLTGASEQEKSQATANTEAAKKSKQEPASQSGAAQANNTNAPNTSAQPKGPIAVADKA